MNNESIFQYKVFRRQILNISSESAKILLFFVLGTFTAVTFSALFDKAYTPRELSYFSSICFSDISNFGDPATAFCSVIYCSIPMIASMALMFAASGSFYSKKLFRIIALIGGAMFGRLVSCSVYFTRQSFISSLTCIIIFLYFFSVNVAFIAFSFTCETYSRRLDFASDRLMTEKNIKHFSDFLSATGSVILLTILKTIILIPIH